MLELYSLQKVLWCKDRKKREPWFQNSKNKFQIDKKCLLTFFSVPLFFYKLPIHQQLMHLLYIY